MNIILAAFDHSVFNLVLQITDRKSWIQITKAMNILTNKSTYTLAIPYRYKKLMVDLVVYVFVLLFVYTAASEFQSFKSFKEVLSMSPLIGKYYAVLSWLIPLTELIITGLLILKRTRKAGILASLLLMIVFTVYLVYMVFSGSTLPCHCGGVISAMTWTQHIWFNLVFVALAGFGYISGIRIYKR